MSFLRRFSFIDPVLFCSAFLISLFGLLTMNSFTGEHTIFFNRQIIWISISVLIFFISSQIDWQFLKRTKIIMIFYFLIVFLLFSLFASSSIKGAQSWFNLGFFSFQPVDFSKLVIILLLSKYFSRRHIEIANIRHILVSGFYVFVIFTLVFLQPDFGGAMIIFCIWLLLVLVSGISKKHLLIVFLLASLVFGVLWGFVFKPYQKARIVSFLNPLTDIRGSGYNAYQSVIAVGSGQIFGKGLGLGTQSKLQFLPEFETDFIFSAFAEEWGFVGVIILFLLFFLVVYRIIKIASKGESNFEVLFGTGVSILIVVHMSINVGMNIGLLPVTGNTLPFMSYGGSHLFNEFLMLGILSSMSKNSRPVHRDISSNEMVGVI